MVIRRVGWPQREALRNLADFVAPIGDLLHRLNLEFFRVAFPAHIHTFWFALG